MKISRRSMLAAVLAMCAWAGVSASWGQEGGAGEPKLMTQGQLAQLLVRKLGLFRYLPGNPTDLDCMMLLTQYGVYPSPSARPTKQDPAPGWSMDEKAEVSLAQFAVLMVRALGLENQVQGDKNDPQNWLNVLKNVQVPTDSIGEGASKLVPLPSLPEVQPLFEITQDPLSRRYVPNSIIDLMGNTITYPDLGKTPPPTTEEGPPPKPITPT